MSATLVEISKQRSNAIAQLGNAQNLLQKFTASGDTASAAHIASSTIPTLTSEIERLNTLERQVIASQNTAIARTDDAAPDIDFAPTDSPPASSADMSTSGDLGVTQPTAFSTLIQPRPNSLARFSSYSYAFSIYLLTQEQYWTMRESTVKELPGYQLLIQSAGAANNPQGTLSNDQLSGLKLSTEQRAAEFSGSNRSPHFDVDFFIDDVEISNLVSSHATGSPHVATSLKFKILEPYGITLIDRLKRAVVEHNTAHGSFEVEAKSVAYAAQPYLMVIRFYGYDEHGNLVMGNNPAFSDSGAQMEKFFPFMFEGIKFRVSTNSVEYQCSAIPIWQGVGLSAATASIPFNIELSAATVGDLLVGNSYTMTTTGTERDDSEGSTNRQGLGGDNNTSATGQAKRTLTKGLVPALNDHLLSLAGGDPKYADSIEIKFAEGFKIKEATLKKPGDTSRDQTPMQSPSLQAADYMLSAKQFVKNDERSYSIAAGTQVMQLLDIVLRTSSYITDQQLYEITERRSPRDNDQIVKEIVIRAGAPEQPLWYTIRVDSKPKTTNPITKKTAYHTTYYITPYSAVLAHPAFPKTKYRGAHKRYDYWFTGENKEVISFEQDYNYLYYVVIGSHDNEMLKADEVNARQLEMRYYAQPKPSESGHGGLNDNTTPAAMAASTLYSLADQAKAQLNIIGDPDWIGEYDFHSQEPVYLPWMPDGGINFQSQEVIFEINFNVPVDYNLDTGIMDVGQLNYNRTNKNDANASGGDARNSFLYRAYQVKSSFKNGSFTQQIEGIIAPFTEEESIGVQHVATRNIGDGAGHYQSIDNANAAVEDSERIPDKEVMPGIPERAAIPGVSIADDSQIPDLPDWYKQWRDTPSRPPNATHPFQGTTSPSGAQQQREYLEQRINTHNSMRPQSQPDTPPKSRTPPPVGVSDLDPTI